VPWNPRPRLRRLAWELLGVILAASLALIGLAHALAGAKRSLLLDDGDSVLLPLITQSIHRGDAIEWGMSPVLFVFPELPLYLLAAALTTTVAAALLLNGVFNVVILYALLRFVAGRALDSARGSRSSARAVTAALVGTAVFTLACLLETRPGGNTGEIASLYLTTTYYSGTVMALIASFGLTLHLAGPTRDVRPRILIPALALGLLAALATLSNPLYLLWAAVPLVVALAALAVARAAHRVARPWQRPLMASVALVAGAALGYLGREPLQRFIIADKNEYFRWHQTNLSLTFFVDAGRALVSTPGGMLEALLAVALLVASAAAAARSLVRGRSGRATFGYLFVVATAVVVPAGLLMTGSIATRYALPLLFAPLVGLVVAVATAPDPVRLPSRRVLAAALGIASAAVLVTGVPATAQVARAGSSPGDPGTACLSAWTQGKQVTGAAQFWTGRGLQAYGGESVHLLQVTSDLQVYPWLVNLAPYRGARLDYLVVGQGEYWGAELAALGTPKDVVRCGGYDIYDYRGTSGADDLTSRIEGSAKVQAALRGFGW
jgi:hypothetical protein